MMPVDRARAVRALPRHGPSLHPISARASRELKGNSPDVHGPDWPARFCNRSGFGRFVTVCRRSRRRTPAASGPAVCFVSAESGSGVSMKAPSDFVIGLPFAGRGRLLYLDEEGELTPDVSAARRFDSLDEARRHWRLAGPSATITQVARLRRTPA
jgi:hypothetical protein